VRAEEKIGPDVYVEYTFGEENRGAFKRPFSLSNMPEKQHIAEKVQHVNWLYI